MNRVLTSIARVALFLTIATSIAFSQSTGSISGTVTDPSGDVIPGAQVQISQVETNQIRSLVTDSGGRYTADLLQLGHYTIRVTAAGFQAAEKSDIVLEAQANLAVNFKLAVGTVSSNVVVQASAVEVQTSSAALDQVVHSQQVADLPLNGRNFVELATLAPGVSQGDQPNDFFAAGGGSETSFRGTFSLSVGGSRENRTDWLYDGIDDSELTSGALGVVPSIDALQEFNVLTSNYSIEYGTRAGPTVLLVSKSGSNAFHGTLFDFLRNTFLNSSSYFSPVNPEYIRNQFGGSVGGPIVKNKTFFFFDYQGTRNIQGIPSVTQVPTLLERQGIFTESFPNTPAAPIYDPTKQTTDPVTGYTTRPQFMGNSIPSQEINSIAQQMLSYFPTPNVQGVLFGDYVDVPKENLSENEFDMRIDQVISDKDRAFARFSWDQASVFLPSGLPGFGAQPGGYSSNQTLADRGRNVALSETHIFSSTKLNQFTAGYNRIFDHILSFGDGTDWNTQLGIPNANLGTFFSSGLLNVQFNQGYWGLGDRGFSPIQDGTNIFQYTDNFNWVHGPHSMTMGMDVRFFQLNELGDAFPMGEMGFDNFFTANVLASGPAPGTLDPSTGNPIASFLLGIPAGGEHDLEFAGAVTGRRWKQWRPYVQDEWRITNKLSLQLALAWNYMTPTVEEHNRLSNFDFATGKLLVAGQNANSSAGIQPYYGGWEPRIGFTYSPFSSKNVVRAGYAVMHDGGWNLGAPGLDLNPPFYSTYSFQSDDINQVTTLSKGFPVPQVPDPNNLGGNIFAQNLNFRPGMVQQFNLDVQRQLSSNMVLTVGYVGARASHLQTMNWNLNTAPPNPGIDPANLRAYPNFFNIDAIMDRGLSRYDAMEVKLERSYSHGLYLLASYTYSKGFDNGLNDDLGSMPGVAYYPLNPAPGAYGDADPNGYSDKGLNITDQTNNFSASALYELPFGRGKMFGSNVNTVSDTIIGNWQLNLISHMASGFPLGLASGAFNNGTALGQRPDQVCNGKLSHTSVTEFFNTSCFVDPANGVLGDASRTPLYGPDFVNFDSSLFKTFTLPESKQLQFRAEIFNVFNHPQFANPATTTDSSGFGQISQIVNNPRLIQLALKFLF